MSCLLCLCALSMVTVVTHTPYVAIANGEVILTTDAQPIALPDTYVVPVGGNVTFTCSSSSGRDKLLWSLNVTGSKGYSRIISNTEGLNDQPGVRVSDESTSNTSIITLHNISLESNPSPVECNDLNIQDGSKVLMIIVEGSPSCPTVHTTVSTALLTVSIQKLRMMWLPESYCVKAVSYNESIASIVHNTTLKGSTSFEVTPIQPDTVYNISVTPCNMAGCNKSCDVHSVLTESETSITGVPTGTGETPRVVTTPPLIFIGVTVAILVTIVLIILVAIASASAGLFIRRKRYKWTPAKGTAERRRVKPQSAQPEYAETAMDHNGTNNTECAVVAHSNTSAKGHFEQGPSRQANTTCTTGPGNTQEYATVQDALLVTENVPRSQASLTNIPRLPLSSPPAPPGSPAGVGISPDCVQDAGYASLPDSRNGSNRITKVRSIRQK